MTILATLGLYTYTPFYAQAQAVALGLAHGETGNHDFHDEDDYMISKNTVVVRYFNS